MRRPICVDHRKRRAQIHLRSGYAAIVPGFFGRHFSGDSFISGPSYSFDPRLPRRHLPAIEGCCRRRMAGQLWDRAPLLALLLDSDIRLGCGRRGLRRRAPSSYRRWSSVGRYSPRRLAGIRRSPLPHLPRFATKLLTAARIDATAVPLARVLTGTSPNSPTV